MQSSPPQKKIRRISSILELPTCILVEILSRLPVNSISDCIYVCKAWYDLLSDPYFSTVYRERPPYISLLLFQHKELERGCFPRFFQLLELKWDYNSYQIDMMKLLKTPDKLPTHRIQFLGCCNGLICLSNAYIYEKQHHVYICNPIIEEYVKLPQSNMEDSDYMQAFGFGCHPTTGQYKVLMIITKDRVEQDQFKSKAAVFTLGVDHTWRNVGDAPFPSSGGVCMIPLNGALHWLVEVPENPDLIYSFDIKEEKVRSIPTPIDKTDICNILGVLRNCLCVFSHIYSRESSVIVIWSMRKYGVVESWTKEIIDRRRVLSSKVIYRPIATWRDGEILMYDGYDCQPLFSYNPKKKKINSRVYLKRDRMLSVIPFVTSYVSLKNIMKEGHSEVMKMN